MRKLMVLPMAGLLALSVAGPVAAGPNVSNTSGTGDTIYGEWSTANGYGYVFLGEESGNYGGYGGRVPGRRRVGRVLAVPDEPVKARPPRGHDPGEGDYGFVGTRTYGYAYDVTDRPLAPARDRPCDRHVELFTETVDECNGVYGGDAVAEGATSRSLSPPPDRSRRSGDAAPTRSRPSSTAHQSSRGTERLASGSAVAAGSIDVTFSYAYMSMISWSEHINS